MPLIYHANEVLKRRRLFKRKRDFYFAICGSLATDMEEFAGVKGAHENSLKFYHYLLKNRKARRYAPFALGMYIHAITDKYIEPPYVDSKKNYKVATDIIKKYDPDKIDVKYSQHLLVEQAIDFNISHNNKKLMKIIKKSLKTGYKKIHLNNISKHIEIFFGVDKEIVKEKLELFSPYKKNPFLSIFDYPSLMGQVKIWKGNMFFRKYEESFKNSSKLILGLKYLWFNYWQDKFKSKKMIEEAKNKFQGFRGIIKDFQNKLDQNIEAKLRLLERAYIYKKEILKSPNVIRQRTKKEV
jgi:hypothetical protein